MMFRVRNSTAFVLANDNDRPSGERERARERATELLFL